MYNTDLKFIYTFAYIHNRKKNNLIKISSPKQKTITVPILSVRYLLINYYQFGVREKRMYYIVQKNLVTVRTVSQKKNEDK